MKQFLFSNEWGSIRNYIISSLRSFRVLSVTFTNHLTLFDPETAFRACEEKHWHMYLHLLQTCVSSNSRRYCPSEIVVPQNSATYIINVKYTEERETVQHYKNLIINWSGSWIKAALQYTKRFHVFDEIKRRASTGYITKPPTYRIWICEERERESNSK